MGSTERGIHTRDVDIFTISTEFIELAVLHEPNRLYRAQAVP